MQCLNRFNKRMSLSGGSLRKESIYNTRELLKETFADDPSFAHDVYFWKLGLKEYDREPQVSIRLYSRTYSAANGVTVKFQTPYDFPIVVGDVIYNMKSDEYLICTEAFNIDDIHYKGKFTLCNWMLKWQNKDGKILEYPCYDMNSTQYNSGEQSNRNFTIGSSQHMLTLPCDENTVELSSPQRFYLDKATINPTSFIVTQNDTTSHNYGSKGLVKLTVYEYPNNSATDRPDLGICDYVDINKEDDCCCKISRTIIDYNTNVIKSGGDSQVFIGRFYDDKENEVLGLEPHWNIVCDFSDKLQIKEFDNCISIGVDDDDCIDEEFKLTCSYSDSEINIKPYSINIKVESLL